MLGRQASLPGHDLGDFIAEGVDFLRSNEPREGYFVGFSGGKDSITALNLCRIAGVKHQAFYSCTRIDPPEVVRFIRSEYPDVKWLYPKMTFWEGIMRRSPPLRIKRWCCNVLKKDPSKKHPLAHRIMGIRAEESVRRASRPRIDNYFVGQTLYKPIFKWPEWAVWEFIESQNLTYPSLYDEGFHRIGCVVCPFILGKKPGAVLQREMSMHRYPGVWKAFEHATKRWFNTKRNTMRKVDGVRLHDTADEYWHSYLDGFEGEEDRAVSCDCHQGQLTLI